MIHNTVIQYSKTIMEFMLQWSKNKCIQYMCTEIFFMIWIVNGIPSDWLNEAMATGLPLDLSLLFPEYQLTHLSVGPGDIGHKGAGVEPKLFVFLHNAEQCNYLFCIHEAFRRVSNAITSVVETSASDYMVSNQSAAGRIHQFVTATKRRKRYHPVLCLMSVCKDI